MKHLKKAFMLAMILAVCLVSVKLAGRTAAKAAGGELDRIVFDGDSTYEWSHFYSIDGKDGSIADLKITVLDKAGNTVPDSAYTLQIFATWWDDAEGKDVREKAEAPYKIVTHAGGADGFCEYIAAAAAAEGSGYTGEIEATFHIMDKYCLEWICAEITFEAARKDGWRMCDRFFVDIENLKAPTVVASDGTKLVEGKDYRIDYYKRADLDLDSFETSREAVLEGVEKLSGLPAAPGGYVCKMEAISPYYGGTEFLLDVTGEVKETPEDKDKPEEKPEEQPDDKDAKTPAEPPAAEVKKLTAGTKAFTLRWTPLTEEIDGVKISGYQIQYSTDKKFKKSAKTVKVKGSSKSKKKVTKLKSGKTYYVRIRTYAKIDGKTVYSDWSVKAKIKTK